MTTGLSLWVTRWQCLHLSLTHEHGSARASFITQIRVLRIAKLVSICRTIQSAPRQFVFFRLPTLVRSSRVFDLQSP